MYSRDKLFKDLGEHFTTIGILVLGAGFVWLRTADPNRHDQDLIIDVLIIIGVILLLLKPILLLLNYLESKKKTKG